MPNAWYSPDTFFCVASSLHSCLTLFIIRQFLYDQKCYRDPTTFNPSRFITNSTSGRPERDPADFAFGFGRRICPGRELADAMLFLSIAMSLWVFEISKPIDPKTGKPIEPNMQYTTGIIRFVWFRGVISLFIVVSFSFCSNLQPPDRVPVQDRASVEEACSINQEFRRCYRARFQRCRTSRNSCLNLNELAYTASANAAPASFLNQLSSLGFFSSRFMCGRNI